MSDNLSAEIMKEVKRYDDGNGCTRRQLVDNILILINQSSRASVAAPPGDAESERRSVLNLIERFQREDNRSRATINALEWLRRQIEEGNHVYHKFEPPTVGFAKPEECARCGLPGNALMHMLANAPPSPAPARCVKCGHNEYSRLDDACACGCKCEVSNAPPSTQPSARVAAEEIADLSYQRHREEKIAQYEAIITKHCFPSAAATADNDQPKEDFERPYFCAVRALRHLKGKDHDFKPLECDGCKEVGLFLTEPGYRGDESYPIGADCERSY